MTFTRSFFRFWKAAQFWYLLHYGSNSMKTHYNILMVTLNHMSICVVTDAPLFPFSFLPTYHRYCSSIPHLLLTFSVFLCIMLQHYFFFFCFSLHSKISSPLPLCGSHHRFLLKRRSHSRCLSEVVIWIMTNVLQT